MFSRIRILSILLGLFGVVGVCSPEVTPRMAGFCSHTFAVAEDMHRQNGKLAAARAAAKLDSLFKQRGLSLSINSREYAVGRELSHRQLSSGGDFLLQLDNQIAMCLAYVDE